MNNMNFDIIESCIQKGREISPFLFLDSNLELLHGEMESYLKNILKTYNIDTQSLFHLRDIWESLKIEELKLFIAQWNIRPRFAFQIFFIENISRMTTQAANACLKFFEEPWEWNIIILTNASESWILETILSRVQTLKISQFSPWKREGTTKIFYQDMITSHVSWSSDALVRYFFSGKYEKSEYVNCLYALIDYIQDSWDFAHLLDEIHEDIWGILKNNLQGKYVVDKYIMNLTQ